VHPRWALCVGFCGCMCGSAVFPAYLFFIFLFYFYFFCRRHNSIFLFFFVVVKTAFFRCSVLLPPQYFANFGYFLPNTTRNFFKICLGSFIYPLSIFINFDYFLLNIIRNLFKICLGSFIYPSVFLSILTTFCQISPEISFE
jgi:hypothetical protein